MKAILFPTLFVAISLLAMIFPIERSLCGDIELKSSSAQALMDRLKSTELESFILEDVAPNKAIQILLKRSGINDANSRVDLKYERTSLPASGIGKIHQPISVKMGSATSWEILLRILAKAGWHYESRLDLFSICMWPGSNFDAFALRSDQKSKAAFGSLIIERFTVGGDVFSTIERFSESIKKTDPTFKYEVYVSPRPTYSPHDPLPTDILEEPVELIDASAEFISDVIARRSRFERTFSRQGLHFVEPP